ncbi:S-layer homology domain-containing protein [Bacillus sp. FJAT-45350]|uniref:S-layer homology domain-containing protein n=1 Tax=Bacillus sp. FJAT-45350 TaxID=2011014 RepID=UPI0015CB91F0|nr:S-layer homology domain-containing protein [Bacillus sp. FJAT-45350]
MLSLFVITLLMFTGVYGTFAKSSIEFSDVPTYHWAKSTIDEAAMAGHVLGYPDGTFRPNQSVIVAEFATFLARFYGEGDKIHGEGSFYENVERFMRENQYPYSQHPRNINI